MKERLFKKDWKPMRDILFCNKCNKTLHPNYLNKCPDCENPEIFFIEDIRWESVVCMDCDWYFVWSVTMTKDNKMILPSRWLREPRFINYI